MKFIYACDVHGDMKKYNKLIEICKEHKTNYMVLGGDLFTKTFEDREKIQRSFIENELKDYCEALKENNITVISIMGNDDLEIVEDKYYALIKNYPNIIDVDNKRYDIEGISFIGLNKVLDAPFKRKDHVVIEDGLEMPIQKSDLIYVDKCQRVISAQEWKKERLLRDKMIDCLNRLPKGGNKTIYILHDPPANVGLDWCRDGAKAGSKDIYKFVYDSNAYMSLHGHIHESYSLSGIWKTDINGTISIQPGQSEYGENVLTYVVIDTDEDIFNRFDVNV